MKVARKLTGWALLALVFGGLFATIVVASQSFWTAAMVWGLGVGLAGLIVVGINLALG